MIHSQEKLTHALETYARALGELSPSRELEARMQAAIEREVTRRPRHARLRWGRALAASIGLLGTGLFAAQLWHTHAEQLRTQPLAATAARLQSAQDDLRNSPRNSMILPTGVMSLWPTQGTVFRVRSRVNSLGSEQQYWIDVRMANDGSMRIERVLSADGTELFARRINPELAQP